MAPGFWGDAQQQGESECEASQRRHARKRGDVWLQIGWVRWRRGCASGRGGKAQWGKGCGSALPAEREMVCAHAWVQRRLLGGQGAYHTYKAQPCLRRGGVSCWRRLG